ncbi:hypothetical protein ACFSM5_04820 [Lacibacterium aquatile]|uniref:Uncharacterized protein n=1 Tax=Lacibacterium aquatile TaxID=1168082 RepID=A0ABW5DNU2_9PROT
MSRRPTSFEMHLWARRARAAAMAALIARAWRALASVGPAQGGRPAVKY